ncbi:unnamed protein product, partial [Laminaria digitata]
MGGGYSAGQILSVLQGEVATAQPGDGPVALGSDSATTCHIVGFRNPADGRTCLAHLDSADRVKEALESMLSLVSTNGRVPLDLYIVGGYLGRSCGETMSSSLISELHASPLTFRMVLACMSRLNSARSEVAGGGSTAASPPPPPSPGRCVTPLSGDSLGGGVGVAEGGDGASGGDEVGGRGGGDGSGTSAGALSDAHTAHTDNQEPAEAGGHGDGGGDRWFPRRTGLAINLASGEPFPVRFEGAGRGPGWVVRSSRIFA